MAGRHVAVAIIGAGSDVAGNHFAAFNSLDNVDVVAAVDIAEPARARIAQQWHVPVFRDVRELADDRRPVHLGVICVPDARHASVARAALMAGWHVLIEKPVASSYRQAARVFGLGARRGLYVGVGLQRRYQTRDLRALCTDGTLGAIHQVHAHWWAYGPMPEWRRRLRGRGGVLADRAVHLISQADDLMGSARPIRVTTRADWGAGLAVENSVLITLDYKSSAVVTISAAFDRAVQGDRAELHVVGSLGEVRAQLPTVEDQQGADRLPRSLLLRTSHGPREEPLPRLLTVPECHTEQARHVVAAVRHGGRAPIYEVRRELRLMTLIDAAYTAQHSGWPRRLPRWR